ncbi:GNAT family N-acetyltransferase [Halomonas sp. H5]|uniref:GNAT family N-acetyltransferase n=1 Tax=Halomonas sp. H5 TaxID=3423910 RepID=UPI003D35E71A
MAGSSPWASASPSLRRAWPRGLGIGHRLVDECLRFARQVGFRGVVLWTNSVLVGTRRVYERAGFQLVEAVPHHSFGKEPIGQVWRRDL